jgi:hypothetical protein
MLSAELFPGTHVDIVGYAGLKRGRGLGIATTHYTLYVWPTVNIYSMSIVHGLGDLEQTFVVYCTMVGIQ